MEKAIIFGNSLDEIKIQFAMRKGYDTDPGPRNPISLEDNFLGPCIRGAEKILKNPEKRQMFQRIYRR